MRGPSNSLFPININKKNLPLHGSALGIALVILGALTVVSAFTIIGLIIFVPAFGVMLAKYFKKGKK